MSTPVLEVSDLRTYFHTEEGVVKAVDNLAFRLEQGRTLGIVGESGSGKSVTSLSIMRLLASTAKIETGRISLLGRDLVRLPEREMQSIRGRDVSMIFQEPMTSLNPVFTVGAQIMEAIMLHQKVAKTQAREMTIALLREVGIPKPEQRVDSYPHQMSGGQKQRVMIAMALSCNPQLLIADEPTTALDVTIQAQILEILRKLRDERGMAIIFITHDLGVIAEIADDVLVMFQGQEVEYGPVLEIFSQPKHPYTKGLLACRPRLETKYRRLPTVDDFMEVVAGLPTEPQNGGVGRPAPNVHGDVRVIEKRMDAARLKHLEETGRGRLLHPKSELEWIGHPWEEAHHAPGTQTVAEGTKPLLAVERLEVHFPVR
ncbi:MAG TPA: ABC transporter ATP-binding protein, partial [Lacipirellulaceae bacterium]|nr:ABC transporter ATP-binding protein [Lacipirellulaceae bacterium]